MPRDTLPLEENAGYVNRGGYIARVIISLQGATIIYADFGWPDGTLFNPQGRCDRNTFRRWAGRQLTADERSKLDLSQAMTLADNKLEDLCRRVISSIPDEMLLAEVRRRGLLPEEAHDEPKA